MRTHIMQKITYKKVALLGLLLPGLPAVAQQKEFNAFDHVLQQRPGLDSIPTERWYDNIFVSGAVGGDAIVNGVGIQPGRSRYGFTGGVYLGKWFTSVSALRLGYKATLGYHQIPTSGTSRFMLHNGVSADYMFDMSSFLNGYKPNRIFHFVPFVGAGVHMGGVRNTESEVSGSLRLGAQATLRLYQGLDFFVEPMLQVYTDNYNAQSNWRRYDMVPAVMAGLTYTMVPQSLRHNVSPFYNENVFHNLFFSAGIGGGMTMAGATMGSSLYKHVGPEAFIGIGNWFTSVSGLRLSLTGNVYKVRNQYLSMFGGQLDYMMNFNSLFAGYHPERIFRLYGVAGMSVAIPEKTGRTGNAVGAGVGVQANFRLSSTTDLFLEPRVNIYSNKLLHGITTNKVDMPVTMVLGLTYHRPDNGSYKRGELESSNWTDNTFFSVGGGMTMPMSGIFKSLRRDVVQPHITGAIGKWLTPVSGLRASGQAGLLSERNYRGQLTRTKLVGVEIDYMLNVSNFIGGYDPDRIFSLNGFVGASCVFNSAVDRYSTRGFEFGLTAGAQGVAHITPSLQLYLEPKLGMYTDDLIAGHLPPLKQDLLFTMSAGLTYNFRQPDYYADKAAFKSEEKPKWFVSAAGGVGTNVNSVIDTWGVGPQLALGLGREYSPVSAWRTALRYTHFPELPKRKMRNTNLIMA